MRVLRPGESMILSRHLTEFEAVLFRPQRCVRVEPKAPVAVSEDSAPGAPGESDAKSVNQPSLSTPTDEPLFFDSTACLFYDGLAKIDYVTTGRTTTDVKGLYYRPHGVVLGTETVPGGYCNYNIMRVNGEPLPDSADDDSMIEDDILLNPTASSFSPITMAAGDTIAVDLTRLEMCAGFLVSAALFSKDAFIGRERNLFYMIRKPKSTVPMCLIPFSIHGSGNHSSISFMVRKLKMRGESVWEMVSINEPFPVQDVKGLILKLQERGLVDPIHYVRDFDGRLSPARGGEGGGGEENSLSSSATGGSSDQAETSLAPLSEVATPRNASASLGVHPLSPDGRQSKHRDSKGTSNRTYSELLTAVPRVSREGRRQYNVGRSHVQTNLFDGGSSEEDEVLDDAMRAVVPCYANNNLVRYENGAYNVGSTPRNLVTHYVDHREIYGLGSANDHLRRGSATNGEKLPFVSTGQSGRSADWTDATSALDRCTADGEGPIQRPELPPDLLLTSQDQRWAAQNASHRNSMLPSQKRKQSNIGRPRGTSIRMSGDRKSLRLPTDVSRSTKKKKRGQTRSGKRGKSRSTSRKRSQTKPKGRQSGHRLTAKKMKSRSASAAPRNSSASRKGSSRVARSPQPAA